MRPLLIAAAFWATLPVSAATLKESAGLVQVRRAGGDAWRPARAGDRLEEGDALRTGFNARAVIVAAGGTRLIAAGNAHLALEDDRPERLLAYLLFGTLRLEAASAGGRQAALRTPVLKLRARSDRAAFTASVSGGGTTVADVLDGLVGAEDNLGASVLLKTGQRLQADMRGLREAADSPTPAKARREDFAALMRRELSFDLARDAALERAASETRREEHELGRLLTDASGNRVRVEEYLLRPSASSVKLVTLNSRADGLAFYSWLGRFDRALPADLEPVLASLAGSAGTAAPFTLTEYAATFGRGGDRLLERADGGHQVDLNANADPLDDRGTGAFFYTLFDRSGLYVNGTLKRGWTGAAIQAQGDAVPAAANDPFTGAALPVALPAVTRNTAFPDSGRQFRRRLDSYGDGTTLSYDDRALDPQGGTARAPASWSERALQLTVSASEWGGGRIEIVGSPRTFILTRQLP